MPARLKICGLTRREDLQACIDAGVDAVGLNFWPGSKRRCTRAQAEAMVEGVDWGSTLRVGVFVEASVARILEVAAALGLDAVQLHGDMDLRSYAPELRRAGVDWIRVVRGTPPLERLALDFDAPPRWTILDAMVEGFGGAGAKTDWAWAAQAVKQLAPHPVWLAGGIRADNAAQALREVAPAGLDVASGAEIEGARRGEKSADAIAALRSICNNGGGTKDP